jgi:hypothetical protein
MIPLNNKRHANVKIKTHNDVSRFQKQQLIPVTLQDIIPLSGEFPIVFVKNEETGQFSCVAMMAIRPNLNLYCQDINWNHHVLPMGFNNSPFSLAKKSEGSDEAIVCIDENSPFVNDNEGELLFDNEGNQTKFLQKRSEALLQVAQFSQQTSNVIQLFAQKKLLSPKKLNIKLQQQAEPIELSGLYLIDEKALSSLSTEDFEDLRIKGLLPLIYAHLASLHQITRLTIKQNNFDNK